MIELTVNFFHFVGVILVDDLLIDEILILICENALVGHRSDPFATLRFDRHVSPVELAAIALMLEHGMFFSCAECPQQFNFFLVRFRGANNETSSSNVIVCQVSSAQHVGGEMAK